MGYYILKIFGNGIIWIFIVLSCFLVLKKLVYMYIVFYFLVNIDINFVLLVNIVYICIN